MSKKQSETDGLHELTAAEIARQYKIHSGRRDEVTNELAAICTANMKTGIYAGAAQLDDDERAARAHAKRLLNGSAPEFLSLPPAISRERELLRERRGIDIVLKVLNDSDLAVRAADAIRWAETHGDAWRALVREVVLSAVRLAGLEARARDVLDQGLKGQWARGLVLTAHIGGGQSLIGAAGGDDPLRELKADALAQGVVTKSELKEAADVE